MTDKNHQAQAYPTKQFFVSMLTRDIKLEDAVLDLLDNCLDGALRSANGGEIDYKQHTVKIEMNGQAFSIEDDCGGIPREIAKNYAFKMGREAGDVRDADSETIGMYGVGMKRAIFKMGDSAVVRSETKDEAFEVSITPEWLGEKKWSPLTIKDLPQPRRNSVAGTSITVRSLHPGVARHFSNKSFVNDLQTAISEHFTMFLQRGLTVIVNGVRIKPLRIEILVSKKEDGPAPFVYETKIEDVTVSIAVGLNTGRGPDDDEDDFEGTRAATTAGWTVFCNDRAIIVGDKSRLTGWGDHMPLYHDQFSIITGIVEFRSNSAEKLPITTTKRALDASSEVWLQALVKMKDGMRMWVTYTNWWKNQPRENQSEYWEDSKPLPIRKAIEAVAKRPATKKLGDAIEFDPLKHGAIPKPKALKPTSRRITFSRPIEEIRLVSVSLFDTEDQAPGVVGDQCFEVVLSKCKPQRG